jgi:hypothetical protein
VSWFKREDGPSRRRQQTELRQSAFWICYRRLLDTQWEGRGTCCIKKQKSEIAWYGKERFLGAGSEYTLRNKTKQLGFEDEASKRIRHSHAQCENNQSVFGIVPRLNRVIPVIERLNERTNKAGQQNKRNCYSRRPRSHEGNYTAESSEPPEKGLNALIPCPYPRTACTVGSTKDRNTSSICDGLSGCGGPSTRSTLQRKPK